MKKETLLKIIIASMIFGPACAVERGVIIDRQGLPEENALYVNLIRKNKKKQKPLRIPENGIYDADRKLFFTDSSYIEPFIFALPGDTISFYNQLHQQFIEMDSRRRVRDINGVREEIIIDYVRQKVLNREK